MTVNLYRTMLDSKTRLPYLEIQQSYVCETNIVSNAEGIWKALQSTVQLGSLAEEHIYMVTLDAKNQIKALFQVSRGGTESAYLPIMETLRMLLLSGGTSLILAHNHPSGITTPSQDDIDTTKRLVSAAQTVGVSVQDHIIVCDSAYCSLREMMPEIFQS